MAITALMMAEKAVASGHSLCHPASGDMLRFQRVTLLALS